MYTVYHLQINTQIKATILPLTFSFQRRAKTTKNMYNRMMHCMCARAHTPVFSHSITPTLTLKFSLNQMD